MKQWHKVTLLVPGPLTSEHAAENPFLDNRLDVTFSRGTESFIVPGFYAADGRAAESSAGEGAVWKVHFRPDMTGSWKYKVSFLRAKNIAVLDGDTGGEPVGADGAEGTFEVGPSDKVLPDFRARGRIINGGKGYFRIQGSDELWIKNGADSPENFLAYEDFDQTMRFSLKTEIREGEADPEKQIHRYAAHQSDWKAGDPVWQDGKGKGIIGAVNYLQSAGVNSIYMLTMNILGDGKDVWPYTDYNERYRFDCSKLDQWELVFDHMDSLGVMAHFVLQETENEVLLDGGYTDMQRRVYLRELMARFGHHLGVIWNLGEENGPAHWSPIGQTDQQKKDMAAYIRALSPWPVMVMLHTHSNDELQESYLLPMLGTGSIDGPSMQVADPTRVHERMKRWIGASEEAGERWVVCVDEIGPHWQGVMPDADDPEHDTVRNHCLWGSLLAGGAGVEWYFGYRYAHNDLGLEDFRSRENWWFQSTLATRFMNRFPLEEMSSRDELVDTPGAYCLAKEGALYLVYLPAGSPPARLFLNQSVPLKVSWFNPRKGGELQQGSVAYIGEAGLQALGTPLSGPERDWVVVLSGADLP
ncbi:MAG: DUF5060 domain-containing protein [Bacteroidales bacterium]|nr:DUF5060 domain-containing protein [Bacteroidales bacterium]